MPKTKCSRGKLVQRVVRELPPPNAEILFNREELAARKALLASLTTYCRVNCGGCKLIAP